MMTHHTDNFEFYAHNTFPIQNQATQHQPESAQLSNCFGLVSPTDVFPDNEYAGSINGFVNRRSVSCQANFVGPSDAVLAEILKKLNEIGTSIANLDRRLQNVEAYSMQPTQRNTQQAISMSLIGICDAKSPKETTADAGSSIQISILKFQMKALIDGGAKFNIVSRNAVKGILKESGKTLGDLGVHDSVIGSCKMANSDGMKFIAALSLPVQVGDVVKQIEFEVAENTELPYSAMLCAASLSSLGFRFINPIAKSEMLPSTQNENESMNSKGVKNDEQKHESGTQTRIGRKKAHRRARKPKAKMVSQEVQVDLHPPIAPECASFEEERGTASQQNVSNGQTESSQPKSVFRPRTFYNRTRKFANSSSATVNTKPPVSPLWRFESRVSSMDIITKLLDNKSSQRFPPSPVSSAHLQAERPSMVDRVPSVERPQPLMSVLHPPATENRPGSQIEPRGSVFRGGGVVMCG